LTRSTAGTLCGDNTDGTGLIRDLIENLHIALQDKRILLLGAGGAARGVLTPLLEQQPRCMVIANRTAHRAEQLAEQFSDLGALRGCGLDALEGLEFDLVINATAAGLSGQIPPLPNSVIAGHTTCYDMMYGSTHTAFINYARQQGAHGAFDGLGMLVEQAAESFLIWRGIRPETRQVIESLRHQ
jgi:shikimate dehydrogenase